MNTPRHFFKFQEWGHWIIGFGAFFWLLLRSGINPKRLSYPCQQAAMPLAASWLMAVTAFVTGSLILRKLARISGAAVVMAGIIWLVASVPDLTRSEVHQEVSLPVWIVDDPVSTVFVLDSIPSTSGSLAAGDASVPDEYLSDPAIDTLMHLMQTDGIFLYRTAEHPDGIVGSNNIVIIKGNYQWNSWNTTSTDRVKGLIWQILNHPDGFTGEIIVCDNTQDIGTGFNVNDNNSEDTDQSILDVVNTFYAKGYPVYVLDWIIYYYSTVDEYSTGDYSEGYIYDSTTKITYPKFRTPSFNYFVSLRHGIWDSVAAVYDTSMLCIIDFPVLKAHSWAGSTIAVKNWIGVMTTAYAVQRYGGFNEMHDDYLFGPYALTAKILAATYPKLTIVDATWTTRRGPVDLTWVQETRAIAGSIDPVAASWYTAKYILTPIAYSPYNTNPDQAGGDYNVNFGYWAEYLRDSAGFACTKDSLEISVFSRELLFDSDEDGINDAYDNCPSVANTDQQNSDTDPYGDACDNCPAVDNIDQQNSDTDSLGDACDNCPFDDNDDQADSDLDGIGDVCDYICGDANGDGMVNVADAVFVINYVFKDGPEPEPIEAGDVNCDETCNVADAVYLINYIFKEGPEPCAGCP